MDVNTVVDISVDAIYATMMASGPLMGVALTVGVTISLIQALTQIQEMTLTFVPKILAIFATAVVALPFMIGVVVAFGEQQFARIATLD
jgi:flagellar biosynthetic protein FliQ